MSQFKQLPSALRREHIEACSHRQFIFLVSEFGFKPIADLMGWDALIAYWEERAPRASLEEFLTGKTTAESRVK